MTKEGFITRHIGSSPMGTSSENVIKAAKEGDPLHEYNRALRDAMVYGVGYYKSHVISVKKENGMVTVTETPYEHVPVTDVMVENPEPKMTDVERAARAIVNRLGFDPDRAAFKYPLTRVNHNVSLAPEEQHVKPLWTFFTAEAEAALGVLDI